MMATAKNDITGDSLRSKPSSDKYNEGWERIFGEKKKREKALNELAQQAQELGLYNNDGE
jgi:hypothetical protein